MSNQTVTLPNPGQHNSNYSPTYNAPCDDAWRNSRFEISGGDAAEMTSQWECEHCTMHSSADTRVCSVCDKTSRNPRRIVSASDDVPPAVTSPVRLPSPSPVLSTPPPTAAPAVMHDGIALDGGDTEASAASADHYRSPSVAEEQDEIFQLKVRFVWRFNNQYGIYLNLLLRV